MCLQIKEHLPVAIRTYFFALCDIIIKGCIFFVEKAQRNLEIERIVPVKKLQTVSQKTFPPFIYINN